MRPSLLPTLSSLLFLLIALAAAVNAACLSDPKPLNYERVPIRVVSSPWLSYQLNAEMMKIVLEEGFGHPVEVIHSAHSDPLDLVNEEEADVLMEVWQTHTAKIMDQLTNPIFTNIHENGFTGREGWYIPRYLAQFNREFVGWRGLERADNVRVLRSDYTGDIEQEPNIYERLDDLTAQIANVTANITQEEWHSLNQEVRQLISKLQPGYKDTLDPSEYGEIWSPDPIEQWNAQEEFMVQQLALPLEVKYIPTPVEENLVNMVLDLYQQRKPFITYLYSPLHIFDPRFGVDLLRVQLLDWAEECEDGRQHPNCVYPLDNLKMATTVNLEKKSPYINLFLRSFKHESTDDINRMMANVKFSNMTLQEAACQYVLEHQDYIESFYPPAQEIIYIPWDSTAGILFTVMASVLIALSVGLGIFFNVKRKDPVIMAASLRFCNAIIIGSIVGYTAIFTFLGVPNNVNCAFRPTLLAVSFGLMYSYLLMKNFRIWRIFTKPFASSNKYLSDKNLLIIGTSVILVELLILTIWFAVDFPNPSIEETATEIVYLCQSTDAAFGTNMMWVLFTFNLLLVILGLFLAVETRKVNSRFRESKFITLSTYNLVVLGLVFIPFITIEEATTALNQQIILCVLMLLVPACTVFILLAPKMVYIVKPELAPSYDSSGENGSSSYRDKSLTKQYPMPKQHHKGSSNSNQVSETQKTETKTETIKEEETVNDVVMKEINVMERGLSAMKSGSYSEPY